MWEQYVRVQRNRHIDSMHPGSSRRGGTGLAHMTHLEMDFLHSPSPPASPWHPNSTIHFHPLSPKPIAYHSPTRSGSPCFSKCVQPLVLPFSRAHGAVSCRHILIASCGVMQEQKREALLASPCSLHSLSQASHPHALGRLLC